MPTLTPEPEETESAIAPLVTLNGRLNSLFYKCVTLWHTLKSYQHGNASPVLAERGAGLVQEMQAIINQLLLAQAPRFVTPLALDEDSEKWEKPTAAMLLTVRQPDSLVAHTLLHLLEHLETQFINPITDEDRLGALDPDSWHWCDLVVRRNGKEEKHQADWLKDVWRARKMIAERLQQIRAEVGNVTG